MKNILIVCTFLFLYSCESGKLTKESLGIVDGDINTYFSHDTAFDRKTISIIFKKDILNNINSPYAFRIDYENNKWKPSFTPSHYLNYCPILPTSATLNIDNYKVEYYVLSSESKDYSSKDKEKTNIFLAYVPKKEINNLDLVNKIAKAKEVTINLVGHEKKSITWSPDICQDAKDILNLYDKVKNTKPNFD
jgi:hypothetical protein